jgi:hypothetical protein
MIRPVSSQLAEFLRLGPTPASSNEVGGSAVNRRVSSSNLAWGANLRFLSHLDLARTFGSTSNARQIREARKIPLTRKQEGAIDCRRLSVQIRPPQQRINAQIERRQQRSNVSRWALRIENSKWRKPLVVRNHADLATWILYVLLWSMIF